MSNSEALVEKIKRLRNERQNLMQEADEAKKLADSEAAALESEVSMLREKLVTEKPMKLTDSGATGFERAIWLHEKSRNDGQKKLIDSKTTTLESKVSMLREELCVLRMDLPPNNHKKQADSRKKSWWHILRARALMT